MRPSRQGQIPSSQVSRQVAQSDADAQAVSPRLRASSYTVAILTIAIALAHGGRTLVVTCLPKPITGGTYRLLARASGLLSATILTGLTDALQLPLVRHARVTSSFWRT